MSNIFDDFYENLPKGRCHPCKYAKAINVGNESINHDAKVISSLPRRDEQ